MLIKPRTEPEELLLLRILNTRWNLDPKEASNYLHLEKGYLGEKQFDLLLKDLKGDWLMLNDLLFDCSNTVFQIDSLLISQGTIYLFEVKNYEGDFYVEKDNWYTAAGNEIKNPLLQLKRSESLFRRLIHELGFTFNVEAHLIFINPVFFLYQAPLNLPIIFPPQLTRFFDQLSRKSAEIFGKPFKLAEKLAAIHIKKSQYAKRPSYTYQQIQKGIICKSCGLFLTNDDIKILTCKSCGHKEGVSSAILRSVKEFQILFPSEKVTTNVIYDWCRIMKSKKAIRNTLSGNFKKVGVGRSAHYI
ncbi:nuclease-related domain-containing protein [Neobacillus terrae]|uniref:nuclease-related domain-containing protein n=1 Tax=Neobacillus terrae TaxID=3034837 RepID=UPI00140BC2ED|nr:nuclease-related domain-containing protein [Neobacillus terrae]NHM31892.1 NERD domain-containing protein [Neobacillus terrae]